MPPRHTFNPDGIRETRAASPPVPAASYGRKSTRDKEGLNAQFLANQQKAASEGYQIPASSDFRFEDDETVGTTKKRQGFDRLFRLVKSGRAPFKRLYVKDKTRLGRWSDPRYHTWLEMTFELHGVQIRYCDDPDGPIDYTSTNPNEVLGRHLTDQVKNASAASERAQLTRRVTGGLRKRVHDGYYPGARAPYGTRRVLVNKLTRRIEPQELPHYGTIRRTDCHFGLMWATDGTVQVVRRIFALAQQGLSLRRIADHLNEAGLPSPLQVRGEMPATLARLRARGIEEAPDRPWIADTIREILGNPIYCGDLVWGRTTRAQHGPAVDVQRANIEEGKQAVIALGFLPKPPVSRARWLAVQSMLEGNADSACGRRASSPEYPLTGFLRCRGCNAAFTGNTNEQDVRYYRHDQRGETERRAHVRACPARRRYIPALALERIVYQTFEHVLEDDRLGKLAEEAIAEHLEEGASAERQEQIRAVAEEVDALERQFRAAGRRALNPRNETEEAMFNQLVDEIGGQLRARQLLFQELQGDLTLAAQAKAQQRHVGGGRLDLLKAFRRATSEERKLLLGEVVERVLIDGVANEAEVIVRAS